MRALGVSLRALGYDVDVAPTGAAGLAKAATTTPDVIVLDLGLPDMDGLEVLERAAGMDGGAGHRAVGAAPRRRQGRRARRRRRRLRHQAVQHGRVAGAHPSRAAAPSQAVSEEPVVETDDFRIDLAAKEVTVGGEPCGSRRRSGTCSRCSCATRASSSRSGSLLKEVWGPQYETETEYLRVYLAALRRKLEPTPSQPRYFITEPGMGYRFRP